MVGEDVEALDAKILLELLDCPYNAKAFQFGGRVVQLVFVERTAGKFDNMFSAEFVFLAEDCTESKIGRVSVQDERTVQIGVRQDRRRGHVLFESVKSTLMAIVP